MTVYRSHGGVIGGEIMPIYSTILCDAPDCGTAPRQDVDAKVLRSDAKKMGWVRSSDGKDYCSIHRHLSRQWVEDGIRAVRAGELRAACREEKLDPRSLDALLRRAERIEEGL